MRETRRPHFRAPSDRSTMPRRSRMESRSSTPRSALWAESATGSNPSGCQRGCAAHPEVFPGQQSFGQRLHHPRHHAARGDRVEPIGVGVPDQPLRGALVEDPAQRAEGLVGLVVLLVLLPHLLADGRAGLAARALVARHDGLLVELPQVVVRDEPFVQGDPLLLVEVDRAVVEGHHPALDRREVDAEGAAGVERRVEPVLGRRLEVLREELLPVLRLEPLVGDLPVAEILVDEGAAVDDRSDAVLGQELACPCRRARPRCRRA